MRLRPVRTVAAGVVCALFGAQAFAGAWTQERGHGLAIFKTTYDRATSSFGGGAGTPEGDRDFQKIEGQIYGEWGYRDSVTLILAPTIQSIRDVGDGFERKATGLAFTDLGARVRLWAGDFSVVSVQPLIVLPGTMGSSANAVLGSGHTDVELRVLAGHSFTVLGKPMFIDVEGAWRGRGGAATDQWRADLALGMTVTPTWQVLAQSFSIFGADGFEVHKGQVSLVQRWSPCTSLEFGYWQSFAGRAIVREQAVFTSPWLRI